MKFYSEKLNKLFDTEEELRNAEETSEGDKKALAKKIEDAEAEVQRAYNNYDVARNKAKELSEKYLKEIDAIIKPAEDAIKEAEGKKCDAIVNFNKRFGVYKTNLTDEKAAETFARTLRYFDKLFDKFIF